MQYTKIFGRRTANGDGSSKQPAEPYKNFDDEKMTGSFAQPLERRYLRKVPADYPQVLAKAGLEHASG
jgi:hypothetical protein